ncbi:MAG: hypothetical protein GVY06_03885 [Alphaproteobacteria bacterium]|jgi:hypothetical protein|nr:hypothetical protein [Alphaproteobacteria bacterium]
MSRKLVAILISLLAVGFAFAAMAAIRWPSIIMALSLLAGGEPSATLDGINWREIGIIYGAPYFLAALCFYAASVMVARRRKGAVAWYLLGCAAGFPAVFIVDFEPGWWRDPSAGEGAVAGLAVIAILLAAAVWDLRLRRRKPQPTPLPDADATADRADTKQAVAPRRAYRYPRGAFPNATARNRAAFAREGRKMNAHRRMP